MIQVRRNCFETNSSSTHCLSIIKRDIYNDWKNHSVVLSIHYIWGREDLDEKIGCEVEPTIKLPENFNNLEKAKNLAKASNDEWKKDVYYFENLANGDNGFMCTNGNFDTYAPLIRVIDASKQVEENVKILKEYIREDRDSWYINYLKENNKYDNLVKLVEDYQNIGIFTEEMYKQFPNYLFYKPEEYRQMLIHDDCYSPFIHIYKDVVAMGYYFHS